MLTRNRSHHSRIAQFGFTLIELAIVLGVVGILGAGLWRLMSSGTQQSKDSATAAQHSALIAAVKGYLASPDGQNWLLSLTPGVSTLLSLPTAGASCSAYYVANYPNPLAPGTSLVSSFCTFLPSGFNASTTNPYGQQYQIGIQAGATIATQGYSFMVATQQIAGSSVIPDTDGGRISSLIGGDGGFVYSSTTVCGASLPTACGALGAWTVADIHASYDITITAGNTVAGSVASRTFVTAESDSSYNWLARIKMQNDVPLTYNTMTTDMFIGPPFPVPVAGIPYPPLQTIAPSIELGNSSSAIFSGTPTIAGRISITTTTTGGYNNPLINLSTGTEVDGVTPCSNVNYPNGVPVGYTGGCPLAPYTNYIISAINVTDGDINISGGKVTALKLYSASDARLKVNIKKIDNPLDSLMRLDAISFALKSGGSQSMGVTAQNLEKVYPQLVSEVNGTKYVEYNGLIGPLIGAVQELKKQNDDLREQLHRQTLREDRLERELDGRKVSP